MTRFEGISSPGSFWEEARYQGLCAKCQKAGGRPDYRGRVWHAHHVIPRQLLRRLHLPEWDTRGALRLCTDCHMGFEHSRSVVLPVTIWRDENFCYVHEALGVTAVQLERHYGALDIDPRWTAHLEGGCSLCQA